MLVVTPPLPLRRVLRRFLQVKLQRVEFADGVKPVPRFAERKAQLAVVRNRTFKIIDQELWSEGCQARLHRNIIAHERTHYYRSPLLAAKSGTARRPSLLDRHRLRQRR